MPTFEESRAGYRNMLRSMTMAVPPGSPKSQAQWDADFAKAAARIVQNKGRYQGVERSTGVPWYIVAAMHDRESSGDFAGVLHNGQKIIGTGQRTTIEPKGRGPFSSWEEAAHDALINVKQLNLISDWSPERSAYELERYNGFGYNGKINSPYLWAGTSHYQQGKYVADGVYSASTWDSQRGTIGLLKALGEIDADVKTRFWNRVLDVDPPVEPPAPPPLPDLMSQLEAFVEGIRQEAFVAGWNARAEAEAEAEAKALAEIPLPPLPTGKGKKS